MALNTKHRRPCGFDLDKADYDQLDKLSMLITDGNMARLLRLIIKRGLAEQDSLIQEYFNEPSKALKRR